MHLASEGAQHRAEVQPTNGRGDGPHASSGSRGSRVVFVGRDASREHEELNPFYIAFDAAEAVTMR
jgi:hypothetical protein